MTHINRRPAGVNVLAGLFAFGVLASSAAILTRGPWQPN